MSEFASEAGYKDRSVTHGSLKRKRSWLTMVRQAGKDNHGVIKFQHFIIKGDFPSTLQQYNLYNEQAKMFSDAF